jgi:hypothetical protein
MRSLSERREARRALGLAVVAAHEAEGGAFRAAGVRSFVREAGSPSDTKPAPMWILANRVYMALPGYNRGGSGGAGNVAFPTVRSVDYSTGKGVPCAPLNVIPDKLQTPRPARRLRRRRRCGATWCSRTACRSTARSARRPPPTGSSSRRPTPKGLIQFTRPPLLPGADVSKIPPADNCAGYLGTPVPTDEIALIRMPHVARFFDTHAIGPDTPYKQEADYVAFTQYGSAIGTYRPGTPFTTSVGAETTLRGGQRLKRDHRQSPRRLAWGACRAVATDRFPRRRFPRILRFRWNGRIRLGPGRRSPCGEPQH